MRLTIIPSDSAVYKDGVMKAWAPLPLDLSGCGIPENVHALQWYGDSGEIEFDSPSPTIPKPPNEQITELPQWALNCLVAWDVWTPLSPPPESQPTINGAQQL